MACEEHFFSEHWNTLKERKKDSGNDGWLRSFVISKDNVSSSPWECLSVYVRSIIVIYTPRGSFFSYLCCDPFNSIDQFERFEVYKHTHIAHSSCLYHRSHTLLSLFRCIVFSLILKQTDKLVDVFFFFFLFEMLKQSRKENLMDSHTWIEIMSLDSNADSWKSIASVLFSLSFSRSWPILLSVIVQYS